MELESTPSPVPEQRCPNCFAVVHALYCPLCGQKQVAPDLSVRGLLRELLQELLNADGRLRRTTRSLLLRPGEFATDYFEGRRARHLPPLRTYLITTVLLFFVVGSYGGPFDFDGTGKTEVSPLSNLNIDTGHPEFDRALNARLKTQVAHYAQDPGALGKALLDLAPQLGLFVLPMLALALYAIFHTRDMRYGHHLIAALTLQSGAFVALIVGAIVIGLAGTVRLAGATVVADVIEWPTHLLPWWMLLSVALGLRRIYGRSWAGTLGRLVVLTVVYTLVTLVTFIAAVIIAFLSF